MKQDLNKNALYLAARELEEHNLLNLGKILEENRQNMKELSAKQIRTIFDQSTSPFYVRFTQKCDDVGYTDQNIDAGWIVRITNVESVPMKLSENETKYSLEFFFSLDPELYHYNKKRSRSNYFNSKGKACLDYFEKFHSDKNLEKEYVSESFELFEDESGFIEIVDEQTLNSIINPMKDDLFIEFMKEKYPIFMSVYLSEYKKYMNGH